ncbi:hypothetical protein D3C71_1571990 [compost metagenome]
MLQHITLETRQAGDADAVFQQPGTRLPGIHHRYIVGNKALCQKISPTAIGVHLHAVAIHHRVTDDDQSAARGARLNLDAFNQQTGADFLTVAGLFPDGLITRLKQRKMTGIPVEGIDRNRLRQIGPQSDYR